MKFAIALFTLVVVCCAQTLAQGFGRIFRDAEQHPFSHFPTFRPVTEWIPNHPPVTDDLGTTPPTILGGAVGPGGLPFPMPGGLQEKTEITQEHIDLAKFAATEIGSEYILNMVIRVQTQVVGGITYHMEITVTKIKGSVHTSQNCEVKIYDDFNEKKLTEFECKLI